MTPVFRKYLDSIQMRYSEVPANTLRQGDMLIIPRTKSGYPEIIGLRIVHIDEIAYKGRTAIIKTNEEETFEMEAISSFAIMSSVPNLIGRKVLENRYKVIGQRPTSGLEKDDHIVVLLLKAEGFELPREPNLLPSAFGSWATIIYDDRKGSFFEGGYDLTYMEAMDDFSTRK